MRRVDVIASSVTSCVAIGALAGGLLSGPPLGSILGAIAGATAALSICVLRMGGRRVPEREARQTSNNTEMMIRRVKLRTERRR